MIGRPTVSLKWLLITVPVLGCMIGLILSHNLNSPVQLDVPVLGRMTAGTAPVNNRLTFDELAHAVDCRQSDDAVLKEVFKIESAKISLIKTIVEPAKNWPLIGLAELHRAFYLCETVCQMKDGSKQRIKIRAEKNHFHVADSPKR